MENNSKLQKCRDLFKDARGRILEAMPILYEIWEGDLWKDEYEDISHFLDDCGISRGYASKLITIQARFGALPQFRGETPPDIEKLYLASKMDGTPEEQYAKAVTWSRSDFKDEKKDECKNHEYEMFCKHCWKHEPPLSEQ